MSDLTPITRNEHLLNGDDLEPKNRKEMYLKRIYDKTQSVPEPETREEYFLKKAGDASGELTIEQLNVTENGTYSASGKAYSPVIVEVPVSQSYLVKDVPNLPQSIATIDDAIVAPIIKLKAQIEAVQSGTGDPYPAGGGKNKIPPIPSTFTSGDELVDYGSEKTFNGYALSFKFSGKFANGGASFLVGKNSSDTNVVIITPQALKKVSDDSTLVANTTYTNEPVYFVASSIVNIQKFVLYTYPSFTNPVFSDCQFENGNTVTSFAPYSNIRPISGWDGANVWVQAEVDPTAEADYSISWQSKSGTVYGGNFNLFKDGGKWYITVNSCPYFASYNGETLVGEWISDRDVYAVGTTPTIGAQVVNIGGEATTTTFEISTEIATLLGDNNIFADCGDIEECRYVTGVL